MVAVWLRYSLAIEAIILAAALTMIAGAADLWVGIVTVIATGFGWRAGLVLGTFVLARGHEAPQSKARPPLRRQLRIVAAEWASYIALFVAIQPFETLW